MNKEVGRFDIPMNDVILVDDLETITNLHQDVLNFSFTKTASFRFDICFEILLAILEEKIKMFGSFGWFIELDDVGALEFHEDLYLPPDDFLILNAL